MQPRKDLERMSIAYQKCWKGYKADGKKKSPSGKKNADGSPKMVNNCVPIKQSNKKTKGKGRHFRTKEEGAGMTEAGVESYKKENPDSNLQTAVTEDNPSEKDAARRRSFCARSKGWKGERGKAARRRWKC
tara:strand:- start:61 stop:453 length:393 start_codon:yes stop_codon:yes gene_type:complete